MVAGDSSVEPESPACLLCDRLGLRPYLWFKIAMSERRLTECRVLK